MDTDLAVAVAGRTLGHLHAARAIAAAPMVDRGAQPQTVGSGSDLDRP